MALAVVVLATSRPGAAGATEPGVHAGLPVDWIAPPGLTRLFVTAPSAVGLPVRLSYGAPGASHADLIVDVLVAPSVAGARAALGRWRERLTGVADAVSGLGDEAFGGPTHVAFARANVFVVVRRLDGIADAIAIAGDVSRAIDAAPLGQPVARLPRVEVSRTLALGAPAPLVLGGDVIAASVTAEGPAAVRQTPTGWAVTRTADGPIRVQVISVDSSLRVAVQ